MIKFIKDIAVSIIAASVVKFSFDIMKKSDRKIKEENKNKNGRKK